MNAAVKLVAVAFVATPLVGLAQDEVKLSCIKDIVYSQEFLAHYPKAGAACREVLVRDGTKWARFDADVVKVKGNEVTASFIDSYKNPVATLTFAAAPEARVTVNGKETKYSDLQKGDTLSFWMPESRVGFYAAPGASKVTQLAVVNDSASKR
ncbi:MAG: hypothetical protein WDO56_26760 [Gammaproteobacteria bacterium]